MNELIKAFFSVRSDESPGGRFHKVIQLAGDQSIEWEEIKHLVPNMCRGWYELSRISSEDRVDFTCEYWLSKIPYHPHVDEFFNRFFSQIDTIDVFLTQEHLDDPYEAYMVYSLQGGGTFYRGALPASDDQINILMDQFVNYPLPQDYLAFLQIHNGFWKTIDTTGLIRAEQMYEIYNEFQRHLGNVDELKTNKGNPINPHSLIPFYESFGMPYFQCFWGEWYPEDEMGNVYYSQDTSIISICDRAEPSAEKMAFRTFTEWLMFYLELIVPV